MNAPGKKRQKIILLFLLGIVLPSLLLGYLAFRGIQNDRALLEKGRLDEHRRVSERIVGLIEETIMAVEKAFSGVISDPLKAPSGELISRLEILIDEHPLVEQVFLLQDFETILFPAAKLLYVPNGHRPPVSSPARPSSAAARIRSAERLEFQQRNYPQALTAYQQAIEQAGGQDIKGELLHALARVQKKSGLFKKAISTYERIADEFDQVVTSDGIPLGLASRLELGSLLRTIGDHSSSLESLFDLYKALLQREWVLEKAQFEFFSGRVKDSIGEIFSQPPSGLQLQSYMSAFQKLEEEEREQGDYTERVLAFQENAAPDLEAKMSGIVTEPGRSAMRLTQDIGKYSYLVSILRQPARNGDEAKGAWGIILNADRLRENVLRPALHQYVSSEDTAWVVKGRYGGPVLTSENPPTGTVTVRANFASNFPDWSLEFYQPPPRLINTFLLSRQGLYFYMFLLITGILVFGLILTIRAVSHELELARLKSDFVSTISHEFKSPLTSIRQLAEMLHSGRVPSEERRRQYYDVLLEQSERLSLLTENILNLARIEEGRKQFVLEKTDIGALLQQIVSSIQDRVRHEGFSIELEIKKDLPVIMVDRDAMAQAITNLIDNAVKYSGESKSVVVSASDEGASLHIAVKDFGIGIRREDLDKVFERFFRGGDELTRTVKGSGLGLTLVREIVEAHHGTVYAESEPGKGSTFFIRLPLPKRKEK
jgi:signal transduction histidine kinase/tetratricopeptide (TPR) repeat protein